MFPFPDTASPQPTAAPTLDAQAPALLEVLERRVLYAPKEIRVALSLPEGEITAQISLAENFVIAAVTTPFRSEVLRDNIANYGSPYPFVFSAEPTGLKVGGRKVLIQSIILKNFPIYLAQDASLTLLDVFYNVTGKVTFEFHIDLCFALRLGKVIRPYNVTDFLEQQIVELTYRPA